MLDLSRHTPAGQAELARLWAMTREQRVAAMWRGELTYRQCCAWSARAPHEVPRVNGEFAWIACREAGAADAHPVRSERATTPPETSVDPTRMNPPEPVPTRLNYVGGSERESLAPHASGVIEAQQ